MRDDHRITALLLLLVVAGKLFVVSNGYLLPTITSTTTTTSFRRRRRCPTSRQTTLVLLKVQQNKQNQNHPEVAVVEVLEGKLKILEEVVKELHHRSSSSEGTTQKESQQQQQEQQQKQQFVARIQTLEEALKQSRISTRQQQETMESLQERLVTKGKDHEKELESIRTAMDQRSEERDDALVAFQDQSSAIQDQVLRKNKEKYEEAMEQTQEELRLKEQELAVLVETLETREVEREQELAHTKKRVHRQDNLQLQEELGRLRTELEADHGAILLERDDALASLTLQVSDYKKQVESLEADIERLSTSDSDLAEQVEIATGAVHAAEKREKATLLQLEDTKKRLNQAQVYRRVQELTLEALGNEQKELEDENQQLKEALQATEARASQAEAAAAARPRSIWRRIRLRFSRA
jgi:hypothetical protein